MLSIHYLDTEGWSALYLGLLAMLLLMTYIIQYIYIYIHIFFFVRVLAIFFLSRVLLRHYCMLYMALAVC